jgi:hypothetical protein
MSSDKDSRLGTYVSTTTAGEMVRAFLPPPLSPGAQRRCHWIVPAARPSESSEALPHEVAEITVHSGAVPGVTEVRQVFDRYHAKPAYISERVDLRWPERIRSVAVVILGPFTVRPKRQIAMVWRGSATDLYLRGADGLRPFLSLAAFATLV